jgi:hypothetical protein
MTNDSVLEQLCLTAASARLLRSLRDYSAKVTKKTICSHGGGTFSWPMMHVCASHLFFLWREVIITLIQHLLIEV